MSVSRLLSVAQISTRLQCAESTVRRLVADGELRASRIGRRTIRISESDLRAYLDRDRENQAVAGRGSEFSSAINGEHLTATLGERILGWRFGPERILKGNRQWMPRWHFQPLRRLEHALQLLQQAGGRYTLSARSGIFTAHVTVGELTGSASGLSDGATLTVALARAVGIKVPDEVLEAPKK